MTHSFHYTLDPILTKSRWDLDALAAELATAARHLARCDAELGATRKTVSALWRDFASVRSDATTLDIGKEAAMRQYADRLTTRLEQELKTWQDARALHERIAEDVRAALREVRGLESHRERHQLEHEADVRRQEAKASDDNWLITHPAELRTP